MPEEGVEIVLVIPKDMDISKKTLAELGADNVKELGLRFDRSLSGLKQAGRLCHQLLHRTLVSSRTSTERVDAFFADMQVLALKDLGTATMFLGVDKSGYSFGQKHAI
ncbi:hypothetical protein PR003_g5883 [Phytophthora rubi]|uniref:Uncharacterized protein n=1 Tax=Phytophthora rubi TaxID=129364 RepID=A0A6A3P056_9STRA|nr:hypothetical protein PR001_g10474 [Phytophthora rubi]KAE9048514.1 hypothetical protein PR002_g435 [Phytophthora rubi]KAE9349455.1 hypothetical protein PR003_g5883 [Phytophthora rubi]